MILGTPNFNSYDRNLRRVLWAEFLEGQLRAARANQFRANIVENPLNEQKALTAYYNQSRKPDF